VECVPLSNGHKWPTQSYSFIHIHANKQIEGERANVLKMEAINLSFMVLF
jgi:hypothetical protein